MAQSEETKKDNIKVGKILVAIVLIFAAIFVAFTGGSEGLSGWAIFGIVAALLAGAGGIFYSVQKRGY